MANKVSEGSFYFRFTKKSFSIFRVPKLGFFVKDVTNLGCKIIPNKFSKILYHVSCAINQLVACKKLFNHLLSKWQISADSAGPGSILNHKCFIVFSLFFVNFSFRYKSSHFIRDSPVLLQDFTPRYERSCPSFWRHFEIGINNSNKIKKMENLRIVSLFVTCLWGKIINLE